MIAANRFGSYVSGSVSVGIFGYLVNVIGCANNPVVLGRLLGVFGCVSYIGSSVAFYVAGKKYKKKMNELNSNKVS